MIKLILIPLMLAWILLENMAIFLLTVRDSLMISLSCTVTHVRKDLHESALISLPTEVLYAIVKELVCLSLETTQVGGSQRHVLALSQ